MRARAKADLGGGPAQREYGKMACLGEPGKVKPSMSEMVRAGNGPIDIVPLFRQSWDLFVQKPVEHIVGALVVALLGSLTCGLLLGPLLVGYIRMVDKQRCGQAIAINDVFGGFDVLGASLLTAVIFTIAAAIGFALLVIPGLFIMAAWGFAMWFVALRGAGVGSSLGAAWELCKRRSGPVVLVLLIAAILNGLGAMVGFGNLLTAPLGTIFLTLSFLKLTE